MLKVRHTEGLTAIRVARKWFMTAAATKKKEVPSAKPMGAFPWSALHGAGLITQPWRRSYADSAPEVEDSAGLNGTPASHSMPALHALQVANR